VVRPALRDDLLFPVLDADHAASGVRDPERPIRFGEDALGPLEIAPEVTHCASVDFEVEHRIRAGDLGPPHSGLPVRCIR
jgi:hypothetical protein